MFSRRLASHILSSHTACPLSAGRMMILSFLPNDFNAFLSSSFMLDLGGFADFKITFMSGRKLSASVCGNMEQACSVATTYSSIGICFGANLSPSSGSH